MKSYRERTREFNRSHPWLSGALFGVYMAAAEALLFHEELVWAVVTGLLGYVVFGYFLRAKTKPGRPTQRDLVVILGVTAVVMIIVLAIRSYPR